MAGWRDRGGGSYSHKGKGDEHVPSGHWPGLCILGGELMGPVKWHEKEGVSRTTMVLFHDLGYEVDYSCGEEQMINLCAEI